MNYWGRAALVLLTLAPWSATWASTQSGVPGKGHGSFSVAYQDLYIHYHTDGQGNKLFPGSIDNHALFIDFDYGLTDRLALSVGLPYKSNRFNGAKGHNPCRYPDCHGERNLDDRHYHGGWADVNIGLRYQWRSLPWAITPFVSYGAPSHEYVTFSHSALGTGQTRLELGVSVGRRFGPPAQNLYFQGGFGYSFMEVVDHRRVNHSTLNLELGYFLTPRLTAQLRVVGQKTYNGLDLSDYPPGQFDEHFFHHDQNIRNDFVNVGAGLNYRLTDRYSLYANYGHTVWGENTHLIDHAITVGISRSF